MGANLPRSCKSALHSGLVRLSVAAFAVAVPRSAMAAEDEDLRHSRCVTRIASVLNMPDEQIRVLSDPQAEIEALLETPEAIDRMARFINSRMNDEPDVNNPAADAAYMLSQYLMERGLPYRDMFVGPYQIVRGEGFDWIIVEDPEGLGYFRSERWLLRYAGSELEGHRIVAAYRMLNNILGIEFTAAVNTDGVDSEGRKEPACAGCHYNETYGLDLMANVLTRAVNFQGVISWEPPPDAPQTLLGGKVIHDDRDLVTAMVDSAEFPFNTCRLASAFALGRDVYACEGAAFDRCMEAFEEQGTFQSAVAAVMQDPSFCE